MTSTMMIDRSIPGTYWYFVLQTGITIFRSTTKDRLVYGSKYHSYPRTYYDGRKLTNFGEMGFHSWYGKDAMTRISVF